MKIKSVKCNQIVVDQYNQFKQQISNFLGKNYKYAYIKTNSLDSYAINLKSFTIFVIKKSKKSKINISYDNHFRNIRKVCQVENYKAKLNVDGGEAEILIAGTKVSKIKKKEIKFLSLNDLYNVIKPWGGETWINGRHPNYAFKIIKLNSGFKTSLQYHKKKLETNFLYKGIARLHFSAPNINKKNNFKNADIFEYIVQPLSTIFVKKNSIHRVEAKTNLILYEISTPHLDDVIRIQDDTNRKDGLIKKEHK